MLSEWVKIPAVDQQTNRELDPRFPAYDVNVQHWQLGQRRDEQLSYQLLKITSFLLWIWPFGFSFYKVPKWNQMIQGELDVASSPEMLFSDSLKMLKSLGWRSSEPQHSQKNGRMMVEQGMSLFTVPAPEGPAGSGMCSQPSLPRVWWLLNGQNKYSTLFIGVWTGEEAELEPAIQRCEFSSELGHRLSVKSQVSCLLPGCADANCCSSVRGFSAFVDWLYQLEVWALIPHAPQYNTVGNASLDLEDLGLMMKSLMGAYCAGLIKT